MEDCIFCKIINGEIPSTKVYEDDNVTADENEDVYAEDNVDAEVDAYAYSAGGYETRFPEEALTTLQKPLVDTPVITSFEIIRSIADVNHNTFFTFGCLLIQKHLDRPCVP